MDVTVSCRHAEITASQRAVIEAKLQKLARIVGGMERAEVHFVEERTRRIAQRDVCEVILDGHGHHLRTKVSGADPMLALDAAIAKLTHQLLTLKSRLVTRYHGKGHKAAKSNGNGTSRAQDGNGNGDGGPAPSPAAGSLGLVDS